MPELAVDKITKRFGDVQVLHEVTFTVRDGEFFTLLGQSGCGKSTTLNCVAGLERPTTGTIRVGDTVFVDSAGKTFVPPEGRNLGMVFQSYALWPHMTVAANLSLPLDIRNVPGTERRRLIDEALDKVGLLALRDRYPHQLSGGQQQRVALARALVYSPTVLLLDEPLSNLDAKLREQARSWLKRLQKDVGITTVYVTHDQEEALALSDRIAVMSEGRMLQIGSPKEIYEAPREADVARFIGRCNFLTGTAAAASSGGLTAVRIDCNGETINASAREPIAEGERVTVAIRPENLHVVAADAGTLPGSNALTASVITVAYVGARYEYQLALGSMVVDAESPEGGFDGSVRLAVDPGACWLYRGAADLPPDIADLVQVAS